MALSLKVIVCSLYSFSPVRAWYNNSAIKILILTYFGVSIPGLVVREYRTDNSFPDVCVLHEANLDSRAF